MRNEKIISLSKYRLEQSEEFLNSAIKNLNMDELKTASFRLSYLILGEFHVKTQKLFCAEFFSSVLILKELLDIIIKNEKVKGAGIYVK